MLYKLKKRNIESFNKLIEEYISISNKSLNRNELNIKLLKIQSKIYYELEYGQKNKICELLANLKEDHLNGLMSAKEINIKPFEVDELAMILHLQKNIDFSQKRQSIINLAYLYIFSIYENRNELNIDELINGHFVSYLKTIMVCINMLCDENIIEYNKIFELDQLDENDITLYYVLVCIKEIKFNKNKTIVKNN